MNANNFTEFDLPKNAYVTFDATTLKEFIISRLNENQVFTDQNYEGSNINAVIDIVAYTFHVLLFYLNTTSSESTFTAASLYENISKIVSNINYKPTGRQTSLINVALSGSSLLTEGAYTLKRFSSVGTNGVNFVTLKDINFEKTTSQVQQLAIDNNILYQGTIRELIPHTSTGENFEVITIADNSPIDSDAATFIADNSFSVFVKDSITGIWSEWTETPSLFLESSTGLSYEKRLNENGNYEFKFGNNTNGKALKEGDIVQIFYVVSDGQRGQIGANAFNNNPITLYNSPVFAEISNSIYNDTFNLITQTLLPALNLNNTNNSSPVADAETADQIKQNAPKIFALQNRLVTKEDYTSFISRNYNNILKSVSVIDNNTYTTRFLRYYYNIGLNKPNDDARVLFNQVLFSNSTSFNNVYVVCVPKINTIINDTLPNYLNSAQKQLIINECNNKKDITQNIVCIDPIYKAFDIGLQNINDDTCLDLKDQTQLVVVKSRNSRINDTKLKDSVASVIKDYFNSVQLGQVVSTATINNNILNLEGVKGIYTRRIDTGNQVPRLNFVVWNPIYETDDIIFTSQDFALEEFQYAFFNGVSSLTTRILIEDE